MSLFRTSFLALLSLCCLPAGVLAADTGLSDSFCSDGSDHADLNNAPKVKVVYAYPSDRSGRLAQVGGELQQAVKLGAQAILDASGGTKTIRYDRNSACGSQYLDIQQVQLAATRVELLSAEQPAMMVRNLLSRAGVHNYYNNFLVFVDRSAFGQASLLYEDARPGPENSANTGGRVAAVFNDNAGTSFFDDGPGPQSAGLALNGLLRTMGAMQAGAPHYTGLSHCSDGWEVLCDGSSTPSCPQDAGWQLRVDCGGDDYFNPTPPAGSWLASHWNLYHSWFLCPLDTCTASDPTPQVSLSAVNQGEQALLSAQASGSGPLRYFWDLDSQAGYEYDSSSQPQVVTQREDKFVSVRVVTPAGAWAEASTRLMASGGTTPLQLRCPSTSYPGRGSFCSTSGSNATEGYRWDWGDGQSEEGGAEARHGFRRAGSFTITVTLERRVGSAQVTVLKNRSLIKTLDHTRRWVLKHGQKIAITGGQPGEPVQLQASFRGVRQQLSGQADKHGLLRLVLRPSRAMRRALRRPGSLNLSTSSPSAEGSRTVTIR